MQDLLNWSHVTPFLAWAIAATYGVGAWCVPSVGPLAHARRVTAIAAALALAFAVSVAALPSAEVLLMARLDAVSALVLCLVSFLGWIIARYSESYLSRESGVARYGRAYLATLASVALLVLSDNLWVIAAAWTLTSLALHPLLTFFDRPAAHVAAHKKFLVSRMGDLCALVSIALLQIHFGSASVAAIGDALERGIAQGQSTPLPVHVAGVAMALAAILKCAQLPFHGWLIQVMEAPTPVSALLHAGIVNIGGLVLIRLADVIASAPAASGVLVVMGLFSAVTASLVNLTRVSAKASLAWSTCAQMGFMLLECGLGLWHLALLHLLAHSLYKAYAFLSAGETVRSTSVAALAGPLPLPSAARYAGLAIGTLAATGAAVLAASWVVPEFMETSTASVAFLFAAGLVPLVGRTSLLERKARWSALLYAALVGALYLVLHGASERLLPGAPAATEMHLLWLLTALGFAALLGAHAVLVLRPESTLARWLVPRLFHGLYLDERFSALAFRLWPPRESARRPVPSTHELSITDYIEA